MAERSSRRPVACNKVGPGDWRDAVDGRPLIRALHVGAEATMSDLDYSVLGRLGAFVLHSKYNARETTKATRAAWFAEFEHQVDPEGNLDAADRAARANAATRAYLLWMSLKSATLRRERRASRG